MKVLLQACAVAGVSLPLVSCAGTSAAVPTAPPAYNPYPSAIVPADVETETARVQREVQSIFQQALAEMNALPPANLTGQPPTLQGSGYQSIKTLGKLMNFDVNMSALKNVACSSCHMPYTGFGGPIPSVNLTMTAYPGSYHLRAGKRTPQRYSYSPDFPVLYFDETAGAFFGGNFWDGRSTGFLLRSADAEQAQHPPLDSHEMGLPDAACIAWRLSQSQYASLFERVWGAGSLSGIAWPPNTEQICSTPAGAAVFGKNVQPVNLSPADRVRATAVYDHWGQSLSAYERSPEVSPFTSKFDAFLNNKYRLTADEMAGYNLFKGKGNCNSCHLDGRATTVASNQTDSGATAQTNPPFTCFGFSNLGLPLNPRDAFYYQTTPDALNFTANPDGLGYRDLGFGAFLRSGYGSGPNPNSSWIPQAPFQDGKFQVSTARNVAMTPSQCPSTEAPGPYFQKAFFHNGYIKSLKQLVHFYNTRDVYPYPVTSGHCPAGTTEKVDCWPMPEVKNNIDTTVGKLGLTDEEENQIVAFLQTLTDGHSVAFPNINAYTGRCSTGGNASTQGNETLVATPALPPCSDNVCAIAPFPSATIP
ncbi:MAG TPA: cytochrome c peroxidase [Myxococcales bacterium]|nr:cytochrome c peroxidase [Myxococcales bacterium]